MTKERHPGVPATADDEASATRTLREVGHLTAGVASEVGDHVAVVLACLDVMEVRLADRPGLREALGDVRLAAEQADRLRRSVLALSRGEPWLTLLPREGAADGDDQEPTLR